MRYAETDAAGVVYYANYLTYFEVVRVELLRALGQPIAAIEAQGVLLPVVEARLKYLRPARLDDLLDVSLEVESLGPASFAFDYEVDARRAAARHGLDAASPSASARPAGPCPCRRWLRDLFERIPAAAETVA